MNNGTITALIAGASLVAGSVLAIPWWQRHRVETLNREVEFACSDGAIELRNGGAAKTVTLEDVWQNDHAPAAARKIERLGGRRQIAIAADGTSSVALMASDARCARPSCWTMVSYSWRDDDDVLISGARECVPTARDTRSPPPPAPPTR